ncbi:MAG: hypothetical protein ACJ8G4_13165 [Burkholderiales bacterium]
MRRALASIIVVLFAAPAAAQAADPGLWIKTSQLTKPAWYRQGLASNPATGDVFFSGSFSGITLTHNESEVNQNANAIPKDVADREKYNHIGDIAFDPGEGGRILLPLESYAPLAQDTNPSKTASIAVIDPKTLAWEYYVKLDPSEIDKAQWVAADPEHGLVWTLGDTSLLAYNIADVNPANAAPNAAPIHSVKRFDGILPNGAGGAVVIGNRIFLSQLFNGINRVISIDLTTGASQVEIEVASADEEEGLDTGPYLDGFLHWELVPGAGLSNTQVLNFVPQGARLALKLKPARVKAGKKAALTATATVLTGGFSIPLRDVEVRLGGKRAKTNAHGRAKLTVKLTRGKYRAHAFYNGLRTATRTIRATLR